jgi:hypothetical protein
MKFFSVFAMVLLFQNFSLPRVQGSEEKPKYGPRNAPRATPLVLSHEYFQNPKHKSPDFWALIGFYVPQMNEASCSAASVAMVLNAALANQSKTSETKVVTQKSLVEKVTVEQWKERVSPPGLVGERGTSLDRLGRIVTAALQTYGFAKATVKVVHVENTQAGTKEKLLRILKENEKSATNFLIANFDQKIFTDDADAGHIAPIAAYDSEKERVLVLDPDREYYEPYWISVDSFLAGMATLDPGAKLNRGYLWIELNP